MDKQIVRYKYRIYPNKKQMQKINKFCGASRWIWNEFLAREISYYKETNKFHWYKGIAEYIKQMKQEHTWLKDIPSQIHQQTGRKLEQALKNKFKYGKGFPQFKKKRDGFGSYELPQTNNHIRLHNNTHIQLPKLGLIKIKYHRILPDEIKSATVIQDQDRYYVSLVTKVSKEEKKREIPKSNAIGIDMGLSDFITSSNGEVIDNLKPYKKKSRRLKIRQRRLSKKYQSNNRKKQRIKVYRIHRKIREQRKDFHHKIANDLLNRYDLICVEDLNVSGLMRTKLAKSIQDTGWSSFKTILEYKAELLGKSVVSIGRFDPSSKTCNNCGHKQDISLKERVYNCDSCGHTDHRDINAAKNILDWGYKKYTVGTTEIYASQIRTNKTIYVETDMASSGEEAKCSLDTW